MADIITTCQILNSYFLHEISSPLSAISSTTDLFNSSQNKIKREALNIISDGAHILYNKVKFYSYAYTISSNEQSIAFATVKKLCEGILVRTKIQFCSSDELLGIQLDANLSKIIMCLIITAHKNISKEGRIIVSIINDDICIKVQGNLSQITNDKMQILVGDITSIEPTVYNCNEYYIRLLIDKNNYKININQTQDMLEYIISKNHN